MKGSIKVVVSTKKLRYELPLHGGQRQFPKNLFIHYLK